MNPRYFTSRIFAFPAVIFICFLTLPVFMFDNAGAKTGGVPFANTFSISGHITRFLDAGGFRSESGVTVMLSGFQSASTVTDVNGNFSFTGLPEGGNYVVTPQQTSNIYFGPESQTFNNLIADQIASFNAGTPRYVRGRVTDANGNGVADVSMGLIKIGDGGAGSIGANTDADGYYSLGPGITYTRPSMSYSLVPTKDHYVFSPGVVSGLTFPLETPADYTFNFTISPRVYHVTGHVASTGTGAPSPPETMVTANGSAPAIGQHTITVPVDASGNYALQGLGDAGTYTITPSDNFYTYQSQTLTNITENKAQVNFIGTLRQYSLSGKITDAGNNPLAGVAVALAGSQSANAVTDNSGNYSFTVNALGDYTVTPAKPNFTFTPANQAFNRVGGNGIANFTAVPTYKLSGHVVMAGDAPLSGVTVTLSGSKSATTNTDANGDYSFGDLTAGGTYTVTPSRPYYSFNQPSQTFVNLSSNQTANFTATALTYTLGGRITQGTTGLGGVTINLTGGSTATTVTGSDGTFSFGNLSGGLSLTVTPARAGYTFNPAQQSVNLDGDRLSIDFTAELVPSIIQFSQANYLSGEGDGRAAFTVTRNGDTSGAATLDYRTIDSDTFTVGCSDSVNNQGGAYARCDFATTVGTLQFNVGETTKVINVPLIDDGHAEGMETFRLRLSNVSGAMLGATDVSTATIQDNDSAGAPNPVTTSTLFFVRQQYLDFLSREPDSGGLNAWLGVLNNCANIFTPPNVPSWCDRIYVSGEGFFRSQEFQLKGFYVFRFYKVAFTRLPEYSEIVSDMSFVAGATAEEVFSRKAQLAARVTERAEFKSAYAGMSDSQYVTTLLGRYGLTQITTPDPAKPDGATKVTLTNTDLTNRLNAGTLTRAQVLRALADSDEVGRQELNNAFVSMQYYGYLRRKPDPAGLQAWLGVLQAGDVRTMVNGFLNSAEYRLRFGQ
jgi:hypothetical protein